MTNPAAKFEGRTGAKTVAAVPAEVVAALNRGEIATVNLTEWLAIDHVALVTNVLAGLNLGRAGDAVRAAAEANREAGVVQRVQAIGAAFAEALAGHRKREAAVAALAGHVSDTVRSWANFAVTASPRLTLAQRLRAARPFAADEHFGVRETAWLSLRPAIAADLPTALTLLGGWAEDDDPNIRRCAVEATRPRGVWCPHIVELKTRPELATPLLDRVKSDPSRYVQTSVANWLNDAAKDQPVWLRSVARRWRAESPTPETDWILKRGLRTIGADVTSKRS